MADNLPKGLRLQAVNELLKRKAITPEIANELRVRIQKVENPTLKDKAINIADKYLLSGQLPIALGIAGGVIGTGAGAGVASPILGVAGAGLGGAAGKSIENTIRSALDLDKPLIGPTPPLTIPQSFASAGKAGVQMAAAQALPVPQILGKAIQYGEKMLPANVLSSALKTLKNTQQSIATSSFPESSKIIANQVLTGTKTLGQEAAERGIYGLKRNVLKRVLESKKSIGSEISSYLDDATKAGLRINPEDVLESLKPLKEKLQKIGDIDTLKLIEKREASWLGNYTSSTGKSILKLTPSEANLIKRYHAQEAKALYNPNMSIDKISGADREFSKALADGLRKEINKIVPEVSFLNKEYHIYDELSDNIANQIAKDMKSGAFSIKNPFGTGGVSAAGYAAGGKAGALIGGGAVQVSKNFPMKTFIASQLNKLITKKASDTILPELLSQPRLRNVIFNVIDKSLKYDFLNRFGKQDFKK